MRMKCAGNDDKIVMFEQQEIKLQTTRAVGRAPAGGSSVQTRVEREINAKEKDGCKSLILSSKGKVFSHENHIYAHFKNMTISKLLIFRRDQSKVPSD